MGNAPKWEDFYASSVTSMRLDGTVDIPPGAGPSLINRFLALNVLIFSSPVLFLLGFFILLGGQNPIFRQERVGYGGGLFCIFKFRTIPDEGWKEAERQARKSPFKRVRLSIFKRVSAILRATGLDELPQFANIVKGNMQIIGPRPLVLDDFIALPRRRLERCKVVPGITGLSQVSGGQELDSASKLALDLYMINNPSPSMVLKIVRRSILRILGFTCATAKASAIDLERATRQMALQAPFPKSRRRSRPRPAPIICPMTGLRKVTIAAVTSDIDDIYRPNFKMRQTHAS